MVLTSPSVNPNQGQYLRDWERDTVFFIERYHAMNGVIPKDRDILEYLNLTKRHKVESLESLKLNPLFKASMESRGINYNIGPGDLADALDLTSRQQIAVAAILNLADRRSDEKKLRDLGISTEEWSNWIQNNSFAEYLRRRSETLINNSMHDAHIGLLRGIRAGNTKSISLYYEMTGRYNPQGDENVNLRMFVSRVLEAIQKHVRDPETLNSIALELGQISIEANTPAIKEIGDG